MKKVLFLVATAALICFSANAQSLNVGAKAGANFASVNGDDTDDLDGRTSLHVGAVVNIGVTELFAVQPELVYSAQGFKVSDEDGDFIGKLDYINIPVLADFTIAEGLSLQGGPQLGIVITDEVEEESSGDTVSLDAESTDIAAVIGAQYRTALGLFFQARYTIGFSDIITDVDAKNANLSVSVGWFFL